MFEADETLQPGTRLGRFEIVRPLGKGGMGAVFLANDSLLAVPVAIKVLDPNLATSEGFERFRREVLLARQVAHPGICRLFDMHEEKGHFFISMEYVEGPTLQAVLQESGLLPPVVAVDLVRAVCRAVDAAHRLDIVHRDLKPGNVIVRGRGRISILDFGLSKAAHMSSITAAGITIGTVHYMSPEVITGEPATPQSDIYSIGVILYECVTGRLPFEGANVIDLQSAIVDGRMVAPTQFAPGIPVALEAAITTAMALEPAMRFTSSAALEEALALVASADPEAGEASSRWAHLPTARVASLNSSEQTEAYAALNLPLDSDVRTEAQPSLPAALGTARTDAVAAGSPGATRGARLAAGVSHASDPSIREAIGPGAKEPRRSRAPLALAAASITVGVAAGLVALYAVFGDGSGFVSASASRADAAVAAAALPIAAAALDAGAPAPNAIDSSAPAGETADAAVPSIAADAAHRAEPPPPAEIVRPDTAPVTAPAEASPAVPKPRQRVARLRRSMLEQKRAKGIIGGDSPRFDKAYRAMRAAERRGRLAEAEAAGEEALAALRQIRVDRSFVDAKLQRFNYRFDSMESSGLGADVASLAQQSIEAIERGDYAAANRLLNQGFRLIGSR